MKRMLATLSFLVLTACGANEEDLVMSPKRPVTVSSAVHASKERTVTVPVRCQMADIDGDGKVDGMLCCHHGAGTKLASTPE